MDTVEWGSVEAAQRQLPRRVSTPLVGGVALAVMGFALLIAAELNPWASAQSPGTNGQSGSQLSVGLEVIGSAPGITYHLGALALLGAVGLVLASPAGRRRVFLGLALGVAAGQVLVVVQLIQVLQRTLEGFVPGQTPGADTVVTALQVSYRSGIYLAMAGVLLLVAATVMATVRWRDLAASVPTAVADPPRREDDRELTVTAMEPTDQGYFARE